MISYTKGNLLDAEVEAVVNTVNTVGVMGKGIALLFKEAFPDNFRQYKIACKIGEVRIGRMFVTQRQELMGPVWIINFPTKKHWRDRTRIEWVAEGLKDLKNIILDNGIRSIAIPPLGCGNGKLEWRNVKPEIEAVLGELKDVDILVYEPISKYQNVAKKNGVQKLTPARALIAEMVRRYWVLGIECTLLEIQKLAWFLERNIEELNSDNPLKLHFIANKYGPYANRLHHLLNSLDGSYLHCEKRLADAGPFDIIWFDDGKKDYVQTYLKGSEASPYAVAFQAACEVIDGFESPFGLELLATVDWLLQEGCPASVEGIKTGLREWPGGKTASDRKLRLFDDRSILIALERLAP
jgi:O-acetyl-ADP-ribose deacetylase (regulator of RNase III)